MFRCAVVIAAALALAGCGTSSADRFHTIPYSPAPFDESTPHTSAVSENHAAATPPAAVEEAPLKAPETQSPPPTAPEESAPPASAPPQSIAPPAAEPLPPSSTQPPSGGEQPAPQSVAPLSEHCRAVAMQRSQDAAMNGLDEDDQQHVYDGTYADCVRYEGRHGPG